MARGDSCTPAIFTRICNRISVGASLRTASKAEGVSAALVLAKRDSDDACRQQYARACDERAEWLVEEGMEIVDEAKRDPELVAGARLRWDARRWYASKLTPKRFGDKVQQEVTGADGAPLGVVLIPAKAT